MDNNAFKQFMSAASEGVKKYTEDSPANKDKKGGGKKKKKDVFEGTFKDLKKDDVKKLVSSEQESRRNKKRMQEMMGGDDEAPADEVKKVAAKPGRSGGKTEPKYRDRAQERRLADTGDGEEEGATESSMLMKLMASKEGVSVLGGGKELEDEVAKSKLLGGDVEHTHLVKGLDYALMERVKNEIEEQQEKERQEMEKKKKTKAAGTLLDEKQPDTITVKTKLAKGVVNHLITQRERQARSLETFKPYRSFFVFDVENNGSEDLYSSPPMVIRPKAEVEELDDSTSTRLPKLLLDRLENIIEYVRGKDGNTKRRRKVRRGPAFSSEYAKVVKQEQSDDEDESEEEVEEKPKQAANEKKVVPPSSSAPPPSGVKKEDEPDVFAMDDIFPDAGKDYVAEAVTKDKAKASGKAKLKGGKLFENRDKGEEVIIEDLQHPEERESDDSKKGEKKGGAETSSMDTDEQAHSKGTKRPLPATSQTSTPSYQPVSLQNHDGIEQGWKRAFARDENALRRRSKLTEKDLEEAMMGGSSFGDLGGGYSTLDYDSDEGGDKKRRRRRKKKDGEGEGAKAGGDGGEE
mmetsp:Transcript_9340/g.25376  ORF Transcript_9340/g.25376 Transcript_9340/m.25376 type:complete len:575 (-) Transcript_9340:210-1934(-)